MKYCWEYTDDYLEYRSSCGLDTKNPRWYKSQDNLTNLLQLSVLNFFRIKFIFDSIRWTINIK